MTKPEKLYDKLLASPSLIISFRDFQKLLLAFGFACDRTVGSHRQYVHSRVPRTFPVQPANKDAKRYQVREFLDMVEAYGLSIET